MNGAVAGIVMVVISLFVVVTQAVILLRFLKRLNRLEELRWGGKTHVQPDSSAKKGAR